ncbi:MAG: YgiT-type zinc finger protein [Candidatus Woesearchaeota archaeon]|jgi:hypothetical protein|nr:YgiT-type zinc finger protein [Candidatus Woesearchaeota archaeon]MDP7323695.1 YgiT-type zinc finger protein [Candidatus Woesearchaeota archaeon]MDP7457256.1 YgiT-type zinc finger protein [Candidatus Woesearchaeota archaeon]|tara:strand:- start:322 stop:543 length:222 start_codon:yes stop_codon:yes gene_type:complete
MKCILCNGKTVLKQVDYAEFGINLGRFPAKVCSKCGEIYFDEDTAAKIQKKSKVADLFGIAKIAFMWSFSSRL